MLSGTRRVLVEGFQSGNIETFLTKISIIFDIISCKSIYFQYSICHLYFIVLILIIISFAFHTLYIFEVHRHLFISSIQVGY